MISQWTIKLQLLKIADFDQTYFTYPWNAEAWENLDLKEHFLWVDEENQQILGFILCSKHDLNEFWHLLKIVVHPNARRQGLAQQLFNHFKMQTKPQKILLEVAVNNTSAINFYLKNHFKILHTQKKFYSDGSDAHIMMWE